MSSQHKANRRLFIGICAEHGKRLYDSKKKAKHVARQMREKKMDTYHCDYVDGMWHVGGKAPEVIRGDVSRAERYPRAS